MNSKSLSRTLCALAAAATVLVTSGCATFADSVGVQPPRAVVVGTPVRLNAAERAFVVQALAGSEYEVEVSRLAAQRTTNPRVRSYALMLASAQSEAGNELMRIISAKGVAPPSGLPADKAGKLHRLASLPPSAAFDEGYVRVVGIEDHAASIALYESARQQATDRDLVAWIDRALAAMRRHLSAARSLAGTIAG